jgi:hypothetical protein
MDLQPIKDLLLAQSFRPGTVNVHRRCEHSQPYLVPDFTAHKMKECGWAEMAFDDLVQWIARLGEHGGHIVSLHYDDGIKIVLDGLNVVIQWQAGQMNLKQTPLFANRLLEMTEFGRKLFDLLYRLS